MNTRLQIPVLAVVACLAAPAQTPSTEKSPVFRGILIDAGCREFSRFNLGQPPQALPPAAKESGSKAAGGATASGITVDAHTLELERMDVMPHRIADLVSRQSDPTCAIKGNTRAYALLLPDGHVADLDEGGNTFADTAVKADPQGRAMLAGQGPGLKPTVSVTGHVQGSRIVASAVKIVPR